MMELYRAVRKGFRSKALHVETAVSTALAPNLE